MVDECIAYEAEVEIVDALITDVVDSVADRSGGRHAPPWTPKNNVRVGVLRPRTLVGVDADSDDSDEGSGQSVLSEPDVIGIDFVVTPDGTSLELAVDTRVVLYQPLHPTFSEVASLRGEGTDHGGAGSDKQIPLQNAWLRCVVEEAGTRMSVPATGAHVSGGAPLNRRLADAVHQHFQRPDAARPLNTPRQVVPTKELSSESTYLNFVQRSTDFGWRANAPQGDLVAFAEPLPDGTIQVSVTLANTGHVGGDFVQDQAFYDCRLQVRLLSGGRIMPMNFNLAPDDYRYHGVATEVGHGRRCVAIENDGAVVTETLPRYAQRRMVSRTDHIPVLRWSDLASDPSSLLAQVSQAMKNYIGEWDEWLRDAANQHFAEESAKDRTAFINEMNAFELGLEALRCDPDLQRAFQLANEAFAMASAGRAYDTWRLFQLVYIVMHLPALAARRHRSRTEFTDQLNTVDVLWFPTGGGKTEAYLGLILVASFYDRLRGKHSGVTAWLKFPLRMLSVQQLSRVLRILVVAEKLRVRALAGAGEAFELGYLVGGSNTPNSLTWDEGWWPGFSAAVSLTRTDPQALDEWRLIGECPYCESKDQIGLRVDTATYRLRHECRSCQTDLPIHMTDNEVFRYAPTVVVSTVDKVTGFAHYGEFTSFNRGPSGRCPKHGYFAFGPCSVRGEKNEDLRCSVGESDYSPIEWDDPVPSLTIQDELHLVREELGAFDSHFESLIAHLQAHGPSKLPTKVLGATATIEQFQNQLSQVYGRRPRRFPTDGYELGRSFYVATQDRTRRTFLGVMPSGGGTAKVEVAADVQRTLIDTVHRWQSDLSSLRRTLTDRGARIAPTLSDSDLADLLFNYEVSLGFVNSKAHGTLIADTITALSDQYASRNEDRVAAVVLTGEVSVPELADAIARIEDARPTEPRVNRLRALVGTSVVSHGVDLDRLNLMVMAGLPSTTADYIQATSRSGRTHVGAVVTVFDDFQRRESSTFTHFISTHRLIDVLVEPVPVNRFAARAARRTVPSLVMALLWDLAREPQYNAPATGIRRTRHFQSWWNAEAANSLQKDLEWRLAASYRSYVVGVNPQAFEDDLVQAAVDDWTHRQLPHMTRFETDLTRDLFRDRVMTSLRDVDVGVDFSGLSYSAQLYEMLFPERTVD